MDGEEDMAWRSSFGRIHSSSHTEKVNRRKASRRWSLHPRFEPLEQRQLLALTPTSIGATEVTIQAEDTTAMGRIVDHGHEWRIASSGIGGSTGGGFLQNLTDAGADSPTTHVLPDLPVVVYPLDLDTDRTIDLDLNVAGLSGTSDSLWVRIVGAELIESEGNEVASTGDGTLRINTNSTSTFAWQDAGVWNVPAGEHAIQVYMRESGTAIDALKVTPFQPPTVVNGLTVFQAEDVTFRTEGAGHKWWNVDDESSGVGTFQLATGTDGNYLQALSTVGVDTSFANVEPAAPSAVYDLEVNETGVFDLDLRAAGISVSADSVWVSIDGALITDAESNDLSSDGASLRINTNATGEFEWLDAGRWNLNAGVHSVRVSMRESGAALDALRVTPPAPIPPIVDSTSLEGMPPTIPHKHAEIQAESFSSRTDGPNQSWWNVDLEVSAVGAFTGANGQFMQSLLSDGTAIGGANLDPDLPTLTYDVAVSEAGVYDLDVHAAGISQATNSIWVRVLGGTVNDSQGLTVGSDGSLLVSTSDDGTFTDEDAGLWDLPVGTHTIVIAMRESGAAVDLVEVAWSSGGAAAAMAGPGGGGLLGSLALETEDTLAKAEKSKDLPQFEIADVEAAQLFAVETFYDLSGQPEAKLTAQPALFKSDAEMHEVVLELRHDGETYGRQVVRLALATDPFVETIRTARLDAARSRSDVLGLDLATLDTTTEFTSLAAYDGELAVTESTTVAAASATLGELVLDAQTIEGSGHATLDLQEKTAWYRNAKEVFQQTASMLDEAGGDSLRLAMEDVGVLLADSLRTHLVLPEYDLVSEAAAFRDLLVTEAELIWADLGKNVPARQRTRPDDGAAQSFAFYESSEMRINDFLVVDLGAEAVVEATIGGYDAMLFQHPRLAAVEGDPTSFTVADAYYLTGDLDYAQFGSQSTMWVATDGNSVISPSSAEAISLIRFDLSDVGQHNLQSYVALSPVSAQGSAHQNQAHLVADEWDELTVDGSPEPDYDAAELVPTTAGALSWEVQLDDSGAYAPVGLDVTDYVHRRVRQGDLNFTGGLDPVDDIAMFDFAVKSWDDYLKQFGGQVAIANDIELRGDINDDGAITALDAVHFVEELHGVPMSDIDVSGMVDLLDFVTMKSNFGAGSAHADGDVDFDADIDIEDFTGLKAAFGTMAVPPRTPELSLRLSAIDPGAQASLVKYATREHPNSTLGPRFHFAPAVEPLTPTDLLVSHSTYYSDVLNVEWDSPSTSGDYTAFVVERRVPGGQWVNDIQGAWPYTIYDTHSSYGLEPGTTYEFRVAAYSPISNSYSEFTAPYRIATPLRTPFSVATPIFRLSEDVQITWNYNSDSANHPNPDAFRIERFTATQQGWVDLGVAVHGSQRSYVDVGAGPTSAYYRVFAVTDDAQSSASAIASVDPIRGYYPISALPTSAELITNDLTDPYYSLIPGQAGQVYWHNASANSPVSVDEALTSASVADQGVAFDGTARFQLTFDNGDLVNGPGPDIAVEYASIDTGGVFIDLDGSFHAYDDAVPPVETHSGSALPSSYYTDAPSAAGNGGTIDLPFGRLIDFYDLDDFGVPSGGSVGTVYMRGGFDQAVYGVSALSHATGIDLSILGADDFEEQSVGGLLPVNNDYDEGNEDGLAHLLPDNEADWATGHRVVDADDELVSASVLFFPSYFADAVGSGAAWRLLIEDADGLPSSKVKAWRREGASLVEVVHGDVSYDFGSAAGVQPRGIALTSIELLLEGLEHSEDTRDVSITAQYSDDAFAASGGGDVVGDSVSVTLPQLEFVSFDFDTGEEFPVEGLIHESDPRPNVTLVINSVQFNAAADLVANVSFSVHDALSEIVAGAQNRVQRLEIKANGELVDVIDNLPSLLPSDPGDALWRPYPFRFDFTQDVVIPRTYDSNAHPGDPNRLTLGGETISLSVETSPNAAGAVGWDRSSIVLGLRLADDFSPSGSGNPLSAGGITIGEGEVEETTVYPVVESFENLEDSPEGTFYPAIARLTALDDALASRVTLASNGEDQQLLPFTFSPTKHYVVSPDHLGHPRIWVVTQADLPEGVDAVKPEEVRVSRFGGRWRLDAYDANRRPIADAKVAVFEDAYSPPSALERGPNDPVTHDELLHYYKLLHGDTGVELLNYFIDAGGEIELGRYWWNFSIDRRYNPDRIVIWIEEKVSPIKAAMELHTLLMDSLAYSEVQSEVIDQGG